MGTRDSQWNQLIRVRNAEVRGSTPLCSTKESSTCGRERTLPFFFSHAFGVRLTWRIGNQFLQGHSLSFVHPV